MFVAALVKVERIHSGSAIDFALAASVYAARSTMGAILPAVPLLALAPAPWLRLGGDYEGSGHFSI
jgi:hypothetical protein